MRGNRAHRHMANRALSYDMYVDRQRRGVAGTGCAYGYASSLKGFPVQGMQGERHEVIRGSMARRRCPSTPHFKFICYWAIGTLRHQISRFSAGHDLLSRAMGGGTRRRLTSKRKCVSIRLVLSGDRPQWFRGYAMTHHSPILLSFQT
jgi:hypothetical protein